MEWLFSIVKPISRHFDEEEIWDELSASFGRELFYLAAKAKPTDSGPLSGTFNARLRGVEFESFRARQLNQILKCKGNPDIMAGVPYGFQCKPFSLGPFAHQCPSSNTAENNLHRQ